MTSYDEARIGLIGCGAIAREMNRLLISDRGVPPVAVLLPETSPSRRHVPDGAVAVSSVAAMLAEKPDVVVEAAGHRAAADCLPAVLEAGIPAIVASVGALADDALRLRLRDAALMGRTTLTVPSGAAGGFDYLQAVAGCPTTRVFYVSRKPPGAFREQLQALGYDPADLKHEVVLFEGTAAEAARRFPKNLNVALAIALAIGMERVSVRVVADPSVQANTHEIEADGALGTARMRFANAPSPDNPRTSTLTAYSLLAALKRAFSPLVL